MKIHETVNAILDFNSNNRTSMIDELTDLIDYDALSDDVVVDILMKLIQMVKKENNKAVVESVFNFLSTLFCKDKYNRIITQFCLEQLPYLDVASLDHAMFIISQSNLDNKKQIIQNYLLSDNSVIRKIAQDCLNDISEY
jgi:hypothetical protein